LGSREFLRRRVRSAPPTRLGRFVWPESSRAVAVRPRRAKRRSSRSRDD
jgi:hypothetical protein